MSIHWTKGLRVQKDCIQNKWPRRAFFSIAVSWFRSMFRGNCLGGEWNAEADESWVVHPHWFVCWMPNSVEEVRLTANDAIISKMSFSWESIDPRSCVELGYYKDRYIHNFIKRQAKRTPIINRGGSCCLRWLSGYYSRVAAIEEFVTRFIHHYDCDCQILCLGAGYDTLLFRLHACVWSTRWCIGYGSSTEALCRPGLGRDMYYKSHHHPSQEWVIWSRVWKHSLRCPWW